MHFYTTDWGFHFTHSVAKLFLVILLSLIIIKPTNAQQLRDLTFKEIENPFNTIPVFVNNPDDAALIITSSLTNLRFDSNVGIVADQSDPAAGEYRLIILPFRQSITVQAPGYKQLRIPVQVTKAKEVKFFTIEPLEDEEEETSPILFSISPLTAEATVFIDGQPIDNLQTAVNLSPGSHTINIESIGYKTIEDTLTIDGTRNFFNYELEQLQNQFEKWLYVFCHLANLQNRPKVLQEKIFLKLFEVAEIASFSAEEKVQYEESLKYYRDLKNVVDTSHKEGREEGREEEKIQIARSLKLQGVSIDVIMKGTGLSKSDIEEL